MQIPCATALTKKLPGSLSSGNTATDEEEFAVASSEKCEETSAKSQTFVSESLQSALQKILSIFLYRSRLRSLQDPECKRQMAKNNGSIRTDDKGPEGAGWRRTSCCSPNQSISDDGRWATFSRCARRHVLCMSR